MQLELEASDKLLLAQVPHPSCVIVTIIHLNLVLLLPLKVILDSDFFDKLRV